jgi:hypothetical protein
MIDYDGTVSTQSMVCDYGMKMRVPERVLMSKSLFKMRAAIALETNGTNFMLYYRTLFVMSKATQCFSQRAR